MPCPSKDGAEETAQPISFFEGLSAKARAEATRVDSNVFRGLRDEMKQDAEEVQVDWRQQYATYAGHFISFAIVLNALQMGATVQFGEDAMGGVDRVANHVFTAIFFLETCVKLLSLRLVYFNNSWNLIDGFLSVLSVFSIWISPMLDIELPMNFILVLRLFRLMRLTRLLHVRRELVVLVESLLRSIHSLGWILVLLCIIVYIFAILSCSVIEPHLYTEEEFDVFLYFGSTSKACMTLFNMCLLAEWPEIVRPVANHQPHVFLFVFVPYLMLCTLGVLNLIIGVIAEQTLLAGQELQQKAEDKRLREKMKDILRLTDDIFEGRQDALLTCKEFEEAAVRNPDFIDIMKTCEFPRGFQVAHLFETFNESNDGNLKQDELVNGMFRLVFNTLQQHACTILLSTAQVKTELKHKVEMLIRQELSDIKGLMGLLRPVDLEKEASADVIATLGGALAHAPASPKKQAPDVANDSVQQLLQDLKVELATLGQSVSSAVLLAFEAQLSAPHLPTTPKTVGSEAECRDLTTSHKLLNADRGSIVSTCDQHEDIPSTQAFDAWLLTPSVPGQWHLPAPV